MYPQTMKHVTQDSGPGRVGFPNTGIVPSLPCQVESGRATPSVLTTQRETPAQLLLPHRSPLRGLLQPKGHTTQILSIVQRAWKGIPALAGEPSTTVVVSTRNRAAETTDTNRKQRQYTPTLGGAARASRGKDRRNGERSEATAIEYAAPPPTFVLVASQQ